MTEDTESTLSEPNGLARESFALVRIGRREAKRFPESCVTLIPTAEEARCQADPSRRLRAAQVYGPSPSSEGVRVFYLLRWL